MRALFAAMQLNAAFRTRPAINRSGRQRCRAVVTTRCRHGLNKARETGACDVNGRARSGRLRFAAAAISVAGGHAARVSAGGHVTCILVTALPVLTIGVHSRIHLLLIYVLSTCRSSIPAFADTDGESWRIVF